MKKYLFKKPFCLALVLLLIILAVSALTVAAVEIFKQSDPIPDGDDYGAYYDDGEGKTMEKVIEIDTRKITVTYVRTENLKELPVSKRADSYGTYDVYTDDCGTEYLFLLDTDIYCGFKYGNVGMATEKEKAIPQNKALEIAGGFLKANRDNYSDYELISCEYSELAGYYDIEFFLPVSGYKSDDIIRLWVDAQGTLTSFSEFNYKRYESVTIDPEKFAQADKKLDETIAAQIKKADYSVVGSYISIDDAGNVVLIKEIDIEISNEKATVVRRESFVQPIK